MKNKYLCLLFLLFSLVSMSAHAQIKVEGNVFDENDTPLIGVSVVAEGGTNGAITDLNIEEYAKKKYVDDAISNIDFD